MLTYWCAHRLQVAAELILACCRCGQAHRQFIDGDTESTCEPKAANDDVYSSLGLGFGLGFVGALTTLSASSVFGIPVPPCCGGRSVAEQNRSSLKRIAKSAV